MNLVPRSLSRWQISPSITFTGVQIWTTEPLDRSRTPGDTKSHPCQQGGSHWDHLSKIWCRKNWLLTKKWSGKCLATFSRDWGRMVKLEPKNSKVPVWDCPKMISQHFLRGSSWQNRISGNLETRFESGQKLSHKHFEPRFGQSGRPGLRKFKESGSITVQKQFRNNFFEKQEADGRTVSPET